MSVDAITLQVVAATLAGIVREMQNSLYRTGYSTIIKENVVEEVSRLKEQPGKDILIFGSGVLVSTLMEHDLIDEYRLMVFPVVLGSGQRLFEGVSDQKALKLVDTKTFGSGVVVLSYQPAGNGVER